MTKPYYDKSNGYYKLDVEGKKKYLHRVIWEEANGQIPDGMVVDHVDGDKTNNDLSNLRLATYSQNGHNREVEDTTNIETRGNSHMVRFYINGKRINFGSYDNLELAQLVRDEAKHKYLGEFKGRAA